jgi:hypothetical protein
VALWQIRRAGVLHTELDQLLRDLIRWTHSLGDRDLLLGVSPLSFMTSPAGRASPTLWSGDPTESEMCSLVGGLLRDVDCDVTTVLDDSDEESRRLLTKCTADSTVISRRSRNWARCVLRPQRPDHWCPPKRG